MKPTFATITLGVIGAALCVVTIIGLATAAEYPEAGLYLQFLGTGNPPDIFATLGNLLIGTGLMAGSTWYYPKALKKEAE